MTRIINMIIYMYIITCGSDTHHNQIIKITSTKCYKLNRRFRNPSYGDITHEPSYHSHKINTKYKQISITLFFIFTKL